MNAKKAKILRGKARGLSTGMPKVAYGYAVHRRRNKPDKVQRFVIMPSFRAIYLNIKKAVIKGERLVN